MFIVENTSSLSAIQCIRRHAASSGAAAVAIVVSRRMCQQPVARSGVAARYRRQHHAGDGIDRAPTRGRVSIAPLQGNEGVDCMPAEVTWRDFVL